MKKFVFLMVLAAFVAGGLFGQARSFFVRADGSDDNNGASEEAAVKTLGMAIEKAKMGTRKTIVVIGTVNDDVRIENAGNDEITITGKANATDAEKAVISGRINIGANSKIRFTNITVQSITVLGACTLGDNALFVGTVTMNETGTLTMTGNAAVTGAVRANMGGGTLVMRDTASITGSNGDGVYVGTVTMSGNAKISGHAGNGIVAYQTLSGSFEPLESAITLSGNAKVTSNGGNGIDTGERDNVTVTLTDNAEVSNNRGAGISVKGLYDEARRIRRSSYLVMSGKATISGNRGSGVKMQRNSAFQMDGGTISGNTGKNGGGVYIDGYSGFMMNGGTISGNKAEYGAGVFVEYMFQFDGGSITGNEAEFTGGGVYAKAGATYKAGKGTVTGNTAGDRGANAFIQQ